MNHLRGRSHRKYLKLDFMLATNCGYHCRTFGPEDACAPLKWCHLQTPRGVVKKVLPRGDVGQERRANFFPPSICIFWRRPPSILGQHTYLKLRLILYLPILHIPCARDAPISPDGEDQDTKWQWRFGTTRSFEKSGHVGFADWLIPFPPSLSILGNAPQKPTYQQLQGQRCGDCSTGKASEAL